ncbi:hypothetical protein CC78DRAFT_534206 [Lojkania enalia]|uniref:Uncharacterized protein n=1 Tax=Lojkania enalia TaxID=147567 RepID=A0A9P4N5E0_9PLEO|nr:hypothetical protein CC78DRAFT_534206 [Didymosphaeria enalia]
MSLTPTQAETSRSRTKKQVPAWMQYFKFPNDTSNPIACGGAGLLEEVIEEEYQSWRQFGNSYHPGPRSSDCRDLGSVYVIHFPSIPDGSEANEASPAAAPKGEPKRVCSKPKPINAQLANNARNVRFSSAPGPDFTDSGSATPRPTFALSVDGSGSPKYPIVPVRTPNSASRLSSARLPRHRSNYSQLTQVPHLNRSLVDIPGYTPTTARPDGLESFAPYRSHKRTLSAMSILSTTSSWCDGEDATKVTARVLSYEEKRRRSDSETVIYPSRLSNSANGRAHRRKTSLADKMKKVFSRK